MGRKERRLANEELRIGRTSSLYAEVAENMADLMRKSSSSRRMDVSRFTAAVSGL